MGRRFEFLGWNDEECESLVKAVFEVLENVGCEIKDADGRALLEKAGCSTEGERVRIPETLMRWAIDVAPSEVTLYDRLGNPALELKPNNVYYGPTITTVDLIDLETKERRHGTREDARNAALVCDALPNISWASTLAGIFDGDSTVSDLYEVQALLPNTSKPIMCWASGKEHAELELEMFRAAVGGKEALRERPCGIMLVCPLDPLVHTVEGVSQLIYLAHERFPIVYIAGGGYGSTAPVSTAGGILIGLADTLVGLLIAQLSCEGAPFVASKFSDNTNFHTGSSAHSGPEADTANMVSAEVFRYLGLPFCLNEGCTDTACFDEVATFDLTAQIAAAQICGSNMTFGNGGLATGNVSSLAALVFCDEAIGYMKTMFSVPPIGPEQFMLDSIAEVGPGGNFLMEDETIAAMYDFWSPTAFKYRTTEQYEAGEDIPFDVFSRKALDIIAKGPQHPLSAEVQMAIDAIVARAEAEE